MTRKMTGKVISGNQKHLALREMIDYCLAGAPQDFRDEVFRECIERESVATTLVEKGLAFPHAKMVSRMEPTICIGYSREGLVWDSSGEVAHIIVLLICHEADHLSTLADMASIMQVPGVQDKLATVDTPEAIIQILENATKLRSHQTPSDKTQLTHSVTKHICTHVKSLGSSRVLLFTNAPDSLPNIMPAWESESIFLVTNKENVKHQIASSGSHIEGVYHVTGNLHDEKAILMELWTREELKEGEVIVCVSGVEFKDTAYRISVNSIPWDLYSESRILNYLVPRDIDLEILSRVIFLALELAREGREGKPVGTLFVLGDYDKMKPYCKQLIINPFCGLDGQSRSILDPSLSETVKEYAKIDGAFIIGNDGLIHSAGTYLSIPPNRVELTSGLGARHAAAMGITLVAPVVSVVISESTKNIRVYWHGAEQDVYISCR